MFRGIKDWSHLNSKSNTIESIQCQILQESHLYKTVLFNWRNLKQEWQSGGRWDPNIMAAEPHIRKLIGSLRIGQNYCRSNSAIILLYSISNDNDSFSTKPDTKIHYIKNTAILQIWRCCTKNHWNKHFYVLKICKIKRKYISL